MTTSKAAPEAENGATDLAQYAGGGLEEVTIADILVGRLNILQALSPELKKSDAAYIEGAEAGHIVNKATKALYSEVEFLPIAFRKEWQEWKPRKTGEGLIRIHPTDQCLLGTEPDERGVPINQDGNEIVEAVRWFGYNLFGDQPEQCFIIMSSTQLKHSRQWVTFAMTAREKDSTGKSYRPPLWGRTYKLSVREESNAQGSWYGWHIETCRTLAAYCQEVGLEYKDQIEFFHSAQDTAQTIFETVRTQAGTYPELPDQSDDDDDIPIQ